MSDSEDLDRLHLGALRSWVETTCGIRFEEGQEAFFETRVQKLCRERGLTSTALNAKVTSGDPELALRVVEAASTGYTELFREEEMFAGLQASILPALPTGPLRFWSAATATGEEAYSIGICALEAGLGAQGLRILGTDINASSIATAEKGLYASDRVACVSGKRRRHFEDAGAGQVRVSEAVRNVCTFRRFNLKQQDWPFQQRFHVIFLRNVLYYFDEQVRASILEKCWDVAEPGGWLVMSYTEPTLGLTTRWHQVQPAVLRKE